jgi:glycosyltransferase involved in cell wall biosynthesis
MATGRRRLSVRVLLVDLETEWRGGQSQALLLLQGLRTRGHEAELLSTRNAALAERAAAAGIPVHTASQSARRLGAARLLRALLRDRQFEIVHANEAHALTAAWMARAHQHSSVVAARRVTFPLSTSRIALARYRAAARIIAISAAVRERLLAAHLDPARVAVVPDGVEIPELVTSEERAAAHARWNFAPGERVVGFVASLTAEKGHELLLRACSKLLTRVKTGERIRLLLAGDGPLRSALERQASAAGLGQMVVFAGFVEDVRCVYAACDLFVFPSLHEGGGTSLLTAMAFALPVIAAGIGGITEIVEDGRNGLLVKPQISGSGEAATHYAAELITAESLAAVMDRLLSDSDLAKRLGAAARETVAAQFPSDRMVTNTIAVFERAVNDRNDRVG